MVLVMGNNLSPPQVDLLCIHSALLLRPEHQNLKIDSITRTHKVSKGIEEEQTAGLRSPSIKWGEKRFQISCRCIGMTRRNDPSAEAHSTVSSSHSFPRDVARLLIRDGEDEDCGKEL